MQGRKLDREILHEYLWRRAKDSHQHLTEVYQTEVAHEFRVTNATMSLAMTDLSQEGRIKKIKAKKNNVGIYCIKDPKEFSC